MYFNAPKDDERLTWTRHVASKMRQYGLSETRLKRLLNNPERQEPGIADGTIALMQTVGTKKRPRTNRRIKKRTRKRRRHRKSKKKFHLCRIQKK